MAGKHTERYPASAGVQSGKLKPQYSSSTRPPGRLNERETDSASIEA